MAGITGLLSAGKVDVNSLVSQLMTVERKPIDNLNKKSASYQTQLSVFSSVRSGLSTFQTAVQNLKGTGSFKAFTVNSSDASVLSASAGSNAVPGNYSIEISSLAQAQQLVATGQASSTATIGSGASTTLNFDFGTISYDPLAGGSYNATTGQYTGASFATNGGGIKSVTIDSTNNTLEGIRDAVNKANIGVNATIINDGGTSPYRLTFSTSTSGVSNSMSISVAGDASLATLLSNDPSGTQNLSQTLEAKNANLKVNGIAITKTSNVVTDAIQGVTLNLNKTTVTNTPISLTIAKDTASITAAANSFVSAYNSLNSTLKSISAYKTATTSGGSLAGDPAIRQMMGELSDILSGTVTGGSFTTLADVGLSVKPGVGMTLDSTKFSAAMNSNLSDLSNLFTATDGYATKLDAWAKSSLNVTVNTRTSNINQSITDIANQVATQETRMTSIQKRYTRQFTNLNTVLAQLSNVSSSITSGFGG
jgi:flagellar hook-associated protein 2